MVNHTNIESIARMAEYLPAAFVGLTDPKPLLMLAAEQDGIIPIEQVQEVFARAGEPKDLEIYPCGHFASIQASHSTHRQPTVRGVVWETFVMSMTANAKIRIEGQTVHYRKCGATAGAFISFFEEVRNNR